MQLTYRGISYHQANDAEAIKSNAAHKTARYRGIAYSLNRTAHPGVSFCCKLHFLGVAYSKTLFY